jgi:hypothetical protein
LGVFVEESVFASTLALAVVAFAAVTEGSDAPPFALNGGSPGELASGRIPGAPSLIVFLDFSESGGKGCGERCASRSQAETVISLKTSFEGDGLRVVLVDAARTVGGKTSPVEDLAARVSEWGLDRFAVVQDHELTRLASRYGVTRMPSVFLLDGRGVVRGRWDRPVSATELAVRVASLRPRD